MTDSAPVAWLTLPDRRRIAWRHHPGARPALMFLPGYRSDMDGTKARAVLAFAAARGLGCVLFDYSGCGRSSGEFAEGTLTRWRDEALALIAHSRLDRVVLIGSSMGGWLMLLIAEALGARIAALVGIAAAPDFTDWGYDAAEKAALAAGQIVCRDNAYGPEPTPMYPAFWADGQAQRRLDGPIGWAGPVRLLHGAADRDVPMAVTHRLAAAFRSADVQVITISDGDHRLSRDADIARLHGVLDALVKGLG